MKTGNEYTPDHVKQRRQREEEQRAARRAARKRNRNGTTAAPPTPPTPPIDRAIDVAMVLRTDDRDAAWRALHRSETLTVYFRRFRYDMAKRAAIVDGGFILPAVPFVLAQKIRRELAPHWTLGRINPTSTDQET